jgi:hypothetical protein
LQRGAARRRHFKSGMKKMIQREMSEEEVENLREILGIIIPALKRTNDIDMKFNAVSIMLSSIMLRAPVDRHQELMDIFIEMTKAHMIGLRKQVFEVMIRNLLKDSVESLTENDTKH